MTTPFLHSVVVQEEEVLKRKEEYHNSSWLQHWWNTGSYLEFRMSNVINVSYFFSFADLPIGFRGNNVLRASLLAYGALKFRQMVWDRSDWVEVSSETNSMGIDARGHCFGGACERMRKVWEAR